ncbi:helix-turn-helix domain-containing protein [Herbaspirillum robiniae]|uniref:Transcriptional regulator n=1 Tax=Herbaspirillum robiniae TaxID=2014887 RepID=A0A2D0B778_9BURK|nr:helix-turn-helix domain-containing protein [Herbaspirillum robiniae]OWY30022.1 transcriptional regulator [Herbaspirillum robiniae]
MTHFLPITLPAQLREHLRALRRQRQLTQAQLGELIGVSQARIAEIEANPGTVQFNQLLKILSALNASVGIRPLNCGIPTTPAISGPKIGGSSNLTPMPTTTSPRKKGAW